MDGWDACVLSCLYACVVAFERYLVKGEMEERRERQREERGMD